MNDDGVFLCLQVTRHIVVFCRKKNHAFLIKKKKLKIVKKMLLTVLWDSNYVNCEESAKLNVAKHEKKLDFFFNFLPKCTQKHDS